MSCETLRTLYINNDHLVNVGVVQRFCHLSHSIFVLFIAIHPKRRSKCLSVLVPSFPISRPPSSSYLTHKPLELFVRVIKVTVHWYRLNDIRLEADPAKLVEPLFTERKEFAWVIDIEALPPTLGFAVSVVLFHHGVELWCWLVVLTVRIPPVDVAIGRVDHEIVAVAPVAVTEGDA